MKNQSFFHRLGYALSGLALVTKSEASFRTQLVFAVVAIVVLVLLSPPLIWWAVVGLVIALVLAAEMFNTAIEQLCDLLHPDQHEKIKFIKDAAAGGVLLISIAALWIALLLFILYLSVR